MVLLYLFFYLIKKESLYDNEFLIAAAKLNQSIRIEMYLLPSLIFSFVIFDCSILINSLLILMTILRLILNNQFTKSTTLKTLQNQNDSERLSYNIVDLYEHPYLYNNHLKEIKMYAVKLHDNLQNNTPE